MFVPFTAAGVRVLVDFTYFILSHIIDDIFKKTEFSLFIFRKQNMETKFKFPYISQEISFSSAVF